MPGLPCHICKVRSAGGNNCNEKSGQCVRFSPFWTDKKYTVVSDAKGLNVPITYGNPMKEIVDKMNVEAFINAVEAIGG
jgi:hypothetical protein